ncbi:MAG: ATP-binding protein [Bacteroidales bacterium]|nr:ATP-binding protein [Bacteroidales bacterium]
MAKLNNPFVIGTYAGEHYFCDRVAESKELISNILNGRNTVLVAHRRLGKTGLIRHCFEQPEIKKDHYVFFIDILATSSLEEFVLALGKEIINSLKPKSRKFLESLKNVFVSLRGGFRIDAITGEPAFELEIGDVVSAKTTLDEIFDYLNKADKPCVVAIDEFQQIGEYPESNIEALLRTKIQHCPNCHFIFAGSEPDMLINMFNNQDKPFYKSADFMQIDRIDLKKYTEFAMGLFSEHLKKIPAEIVHCAYHAVDGVTLYVQFIMNELFQLVAPHKTATHDDYLNAVDILLRKHSFVFQNALSSLSLKQKELLYALARENRPVELTSSEFINKYRLRSASSVQSALKGLVSKKIITKENKFYVIADRLFRLWLIR